MKNNPPYTVCFLIYHREDAAKNKGYIDLWKEHCKKRRLSCNLLILEDLLPPSGYDTASPCPLSTSKAPGKICDRNDSKASRFSVLSELPCGSFVINRTRISSLSRYCELHNIPVFNGSRLVTLGNDKTAAYEYVSSLGLSVLPYFKSPDAPGLSFPCVMKSADGHGGTEVFLLRSPDETAVIMSDHPDRRWLFQELCDTPGKDLRVYLVGNKIVGAMLRSSDTDFKANYSLGAKSEPYQLNTEEIKLVQTIAAPLTIGHCGIDFLFHQGKAVFNEIEDVVGSRMLYRHTDIDVVSLYLDEISEQLSIL